jgi:4,5:9,10-diseco-3-hydroxy-5,9,17-trioxoandrosta-1(10),2-diene-4-oate hydrolase
VPIPEGKYAELANGYKMHYLEQGSGHPVVFLHGSGQGASGHSNFKGNYPFLAENGYRVIVPDHIGYGYSDKPQDVEYPLSFFVECIVQTLDVIGVDKVSLIGNSLGGAIALSIALEHPERVASLNLMAPGGLEEKEDYFKMPGMAILGQIMASGEVNKDSLEKFIRDGLVYNEDCVDDELIDERWDIFTKQNGQALATMKVPNMTERLGDINCPSICFWGMNEKMMPETGIMKLAKGLRNTRVVLVSECGHWVMAEHQAMFNEYTLNFLNEKVA